MVRPLQHCLVSATWWPLQDTDEAGKPATKVPGIELCEFEYQSDRWDKPRRVIGICQQIKLRDQAKGKNLSLFEDDPDLSQWRYGAIVTNLGLPALEIWRMDRGRADCENLIKEWKYDFAQGTLARQNFWATEAALHWEMLAFNLMSLFRTALQRQLNRGASLQTLATLRHQLLTQAGFITKTGRLRTLKLATARQRREWITGLWDTTKTFEIPWPVKPIFSPVPTV